MAAASRRDGKTMSVRSEVHVVGGWNQRNPRGPSPALTRRYRGATRDPSPSWSQGRRQHRRQARERSPLTRRHWQVRDTASPYCLYQRGAKDSSPPFTKRQRASKASHPSSTQYRRDSRPYRRDARDRSQRNHRDRRNVNLYSPDRAWKRETRKESPFTTGRYCRDTDRFPPCSRYQRERKARDMSPPEDRRNVSDVHKEQPVAVQGASDPLSLSLISLNNSQSISLLSSPDVETENNSPVSAPEVEVKAEVTPVSSSPDDENQIEDEGQATPLLSWSADDSLTLSPIKSTPDHSAPSMTLLPTDRDSNTSCLSIKWTSTPVKNRPDDCSDTSTFLDSPSMILDLLAAEMSSEVLDASDSLGPVETTLHTSPLSCQATDTDTDTCQRWS